MNKTFGVKYTYIDGELFGFPQRNSLVTFIGDAIERNKNWELASAGEHAYTHTQDYDEDDDRYVACARDSTKMVNLTAYYNEPSGGIETSQMKMLISHIDLDNDTTAGQSEENPKEMP
ncbi:hypothetical protein TTRE_0000285501 [Trichuris trichiura]|uniref:Uncharacterized protein n=1 Tax=Trichuris trichiura TaxID=36087 RepID=A0A077Z7D6_TRITR|nr:hypothetical protein TTRE_0000285501 [Trichuris trichiura]